MGWRDEDKIYTQSDMDALRQENRRLHEVIRELTKLTDDKAAGAVVGRELKK